uniref:Putative ovule protein n=1 Tax=Solanum chacoense TaxID=4108 RepID=A0A0V0HIT4_SOLCH
MNSNKKHSTRIGTVSWTHDCCLPMKHIFSYWASTARGRRIFLEILQLLENPFGCHSRPNPSEILLWYCNSEFWNW